MKVDIKSIVVGAVVGLLIGSVVTFVVYRSHERDAIIRVLAEQDVLKEQRDEIITSLTSVTTEQGKKIDEMKELFGRISATVNESSDTVTKALSVIKRLKDIVKEMP